MNQNTNADKSTMTHNLTNAEKAVAEAWLEMLGPHFTTLIQNAMLAALRKHAEETGATDVVAETRQDILRQTIAQTVEHLRPVQKPSKEEMLNLVGEFDGDKWAQLFVRQFPRTVDVDTIRGWFANAIMAGYDHHAKEVRKKHKCMGDCLDIQGSNGNWNANEYMLGMFNGMEHMMAIMEDRDPQFRTLPKGAVSESFKAHAPEHIVKAEEARASSTEVPGEREVWAQAYAAMLPQCGVGSSDAAKHADEDVKAFRERYK